MARKRNAESARLEADYLSRVRSALSGREASEIEEVAQSLAEHIEEDLSGETGDVTLVQMANVLEHLGPPESFGGDIGDGRTPRPPISRLAVVGALGAPVGVAAGLFFLAMTRLFNARVHENNLYAAALVIAVSFGIVGLALGLAARSAIGRSGGTLDGERLAAWGIRLPIALFILAVAGWVAWFCIDLAAERERARNYQIEVATVQCQNLWGACRDALVSTRPDAEIMERLLDSNALDPAWAADARAGKAAAGPQTFLSLRNDPAIAPRLAGVAFYGITFGKRDNLAAIVAECGNGKLLIPVIRLDGRWYLARQPATIR